MDIRIVILQRGWVMVGLFKQTGSKCTLSDASVVRRWGTTGGIGELAANGPLENTKLDPAGEVEFHELTAIANLKCTEAKWKKLFK